MTVIASIHVSESLQTLIDCRLDTIDRMLLGRLPRSERVEIVREVESQIFDLLGERNSDELTREDVLAVLARLDPPEAYLPDEARSEPLPRRGAATALPRQPLRERDPWTGRVSGIRLRRQGSCQGRVGRRGAGYQHLCALAFSCGRRTRTDRIVRRLGRFSAGCAPAPWQGERGHLENAECGTGNGGRRNGG